MEIDLEKISGLPILFDEKNINLRFNNEFPFLKKSERSFDDLKPYLKSRGFVKKTYPAYTVWRCAHLRKDDEKIRPSFLRYDLTLIPPGAIDGEFVKTAGHYHLPYPEVYEVLSGRAYFLIQKPGKNFQNIESVYLIESGPGEKFLIPPGFGHNTINVFNKPLLLANWVSEKTVYDYESYKNLHGASYYFTENKELIDVEKNPNYESVPEIKKVKTGEYPEFGILKNKPLYSLVDDINRLRFLNHPGEFKGEWRNW